MKKKIIACLVLAAIIAAIALYLNLSVIKRKDPICFAPTYSQYASTLNDQLLFFFDGSLYLADDKEGSLSLTPMAVEIENQGEAVSLQQAPDRLSTYLVKQENSLSLFIDKLTADQEIVNVAELKKELRDPISPIISEDICYYVKGNPEGSGGFGRTLRMFPLSDTTNVTSLYVWKDMDPQDILTGLRKYDNYLVMVYNIGGQNTLWVYDTNKQEMIIEGDADMSEAAYFAGKIYYIEDEGRRIYAYDLAGGEKAEVNILFENYQPGDTLSCDQDYLYVNHGDSSCVSVYPCRGGLVTTIDLATNKDAVEREIEDNPFYSVYLCSTSDYVFIGKANYLGLSAVFYVDKSQIESGNPKVHTLYIKRRVE